MLHAWIDTALELGASVVDPPQAFGVEARLLDPEGHHQRQLVMAAL